MKLIGMREYIMQFANVEPEYPDYLACISYAKFLSQPLTLDMFAPCDLEGNVLEEPYYSPDFQYKFDEKVKEYQQAKERVLFEGFEVNTRHCNDVPFDFVSKDEFYVFSKDPGKQFVINENIKIVEDLIDFGTEITLTQQAIKQITP